MVLSFTQFCLATMVVGIYLFDSKIGSSPFILLRNEMNWPILSRPDYLSLLKDGTGLNTLLQNYWMVIHPPTLFLGFATAIVPFAYSLSALWRGNDRGWIAPAHIWSLICAGILGLGIIMGGFWAYESLSFGGYWAWDPVENASMVPWLLLVAGIHTILIFQSTGYSLKASYLFIVLTFLFVIVSVGVTDSRFVYNRDGLITTCWHTQPAPTFGVAVNEAFPVAVTAGRTP